MTPQRRNNLERLLAPRHIVFVGGEEALLASRQCAAAGYEGQIWGVNPGRATLDGHPCFACVADLPQAPDAVFLAVPRRAAVGVVRELGRIGTGGVVCYTAGFRETGAQGAEMEAALVRAAGEMALVGPNVFGMLNYTNGAHLWPYSHGGRRVERGPAIISQSGMLSSYLLTNRRSVDFSFVIGAGNQSVLGVEDYLETLLDNPAVTGFGLYLEALRDVPRFAAAATRALERNLPIVVLKVGRSALAVRSTVTHTGSLCGSDDLYQALFDRFGVARVSTPSLLLEALNMLTVAGAPRGARLAAFTCSGGDAAMLADQAEECGIDFAQPSERVRSALRERLPEIATVSNPLDYTTPLWGKAEALERVFDAMLCDDYDAALLVQDYLPQGLGDDRHFYIADASAFVDAVRRAGIPGAVCASLPENLDEDIRRFLIERGTAPLHGIGEAVCAIAAAAVFGRCRSAYAEHPEQFTLTPPGGDVRGAEVLDEWRGKRLIDAAGVPVPRGDVSDAACAPSCAERLGFPVVLKLLDPDVPHKTEAGAVSLGLRSAAEVAAAAQDIHCRATAYLGAEPRNCFLIERMVERPLAELLIGVQNDAQFGLVLTIASGGVLVELARDSRTLLLPASRGEIAHALDALKVSRLLDGYRKRPAADKGAVIDAVCAVATFAEEAGGRLAELDINPLIVHRAGCTAADVLIRMTPA